MEYERRSAAQANTLKLQKYLRKSGFEEIKAMKFE